MARPARAPPQTYPGTTSGYGPTRGDSIGPNPMNPKAYMPSQSVKAYDSSKGKVIDPRGMIKDAG